jgi:glycosyltransferase involved in cell wall biosynthesis
MKIIIIRSRAIDPAVNKLAEILAKNGYDVTLLVWDRQNNLKDTSNKSFKTIRFLLKAPYDRPAVLFFLPLWWLFEFGYLLMNKYDVIHSCDLDTLIPAIIVKRIKNIKLYYTIYDFYANNLPYGPLHFVRNTLRKFVASIEIYCIGHTDALFLVDECRFENIKSARIKNLIYVYNSPIDFYKEERICESSNNGILSVFFAGVIHKSRGLSYLLEAVEELDWVKLVIAGKGPEENFIKNEVKKYPNIDYLGFIDYLEVMHRTLEADVLFAMYDPTIPANKYASPNKLFEAMMSGKPIIINDGNSAADIVRKENCGLVIPYGVTVEIKNALVKLKNDFKLRNILGENGRKAYIEKYSWNIMAERILKAYKDDKT